MKKFRVKVDANSNAKPDQVKDGYLALFGVIQTYGRGEAIKKARMFKGTIELVKLSTVFAPLSMVAIPENALLDGVVKILEKEKLAAFVEADKTRKEKIYHGDVFRSILDDVETRITNKKVLAQVIELAEMIDQDYIMITQS